MHIAWTIALLFVIGFLILKQPRKIRRVSADVLVETVFLSEYEMVGVLDAKRSYTYRTYTNKTTDVLTSVTGAAPLRWDRSCALVGRQLDPPQSSGPTKLRVFVTRGPTVLSARWATRTDTTDPWVREHVVFVRTLDEADLHVSTTRIYGGGSTPLFYPYINLWNGIFHPDVPGVAFGVGCAMLGPTAETVYGFRDLVDIKLPIFHKESVISDASRPPALARTILASFFGDIRDGHWGVGGNGRPWEYDGAYRDRAIALLTTGPHVIVEKITDGHSPRFVELMQRSKYALCPSGAGVHSYRFVDALRAGAVPVVTADTMLPFETARGIPGQIVSWDACVVRVHRQKLQVIETILSAIPKRTYQEQQRACRRLYDAHLRDSDARLRTMYQILYDRFTARRVGFDAAAA